MAKISQRISTVNFTVNSSSEERGETEKGKEIIQQRRHLEEKEKSFQCRVGEKEWE